MHESVVFASGVLGGAIAAFGVWRWACGHDRLKRTPKGERQTPRYAHNQHQQRPGVRVSWLNRIRPRRSKHVVMFSSEDQARGLAPKWADDGAQRPLFLRPERRAAERPPEPGQGWAEGGHWVDLGAPREAAVRLLHGDTHRPERQGGVIRFRRRRGEVGHG
jgi:hypothetical protein